MGAGASALPDVLKEKSSEEIATALEELPAETLARIHWAAAQAQAGEEGPQEDEDLASAIRLSLAPSAQAADQLQFQQEDHGAAAQPKKATASSAKESAHSVDDVSKDAKITIGSRVAVHGLQKKPELNGHKGLCVGRGDTGRWTVHLDSGEVCALKSENLTKLDEATIAVGMHVEVQDLRARPELNGRAGHCMDRAANGRWSVRLESGETVSIKSDNLKPLPTSISPGSHNRLGGTVWELQALINNGTAAGQSGQSSRALEYFTQGLAVARQLGHCQGEGSALANLGITYANLAQYDKAIECHSQALTIIRTMGDRQTEGNILSNLGNSYCSLSQYDKAIGYYTQALAISREMRNRQGEGYALGNLGNAYNSLSQWAKAMDYYRQALHISRETGDRIAECLSLGNVGLAHKSLCQYDKAIEYYDQALSLSRTIGDRQSESNQLGNLGSVYYLLSQYPKAIQYHNEALVLSRQTGNRQDECSNLSNLGLVHEKLGEYQKAIRFFSEALSMSREIGDRQSQASCLGNLSQAHHRLEQFEKSIEYSGEALELSRTIGDRHIEGISLNELGLAYKSLGLYEKAIEYYSQMLTTSRTTGDRQIQATCLANLGHAYYRLRRCEKAIEILSEALALYDMIWGELRTDDRRITFADYEFSACSRNLQCAHIGLDQPDQALLCAERGRARAFEMLLAQQRQHEAVMAVPVENPTRLESVEIIQDMAIRQQTAIVVYSQVTANMLLAWSFGSSPGSCTFKQLPLPEDDISITQLIECTRQSVGIKARSGTGASSAGSENAGGSDERQISTLDEARLAQDLQQMNGTEADAGDSSSKCHQMLRRCHELIFEPLEASLAGEARLLIVPDADLYALPFAALSNKDGSYLIERHALRVAPSLGTIIELERALEKRAAHGRHTARGDPSALVVGDPSCHGLSSLDGALKEAQDVETRLRRSYKTRLLSGDDATKENVLEAMHASEVLHFAAHGGAFGVCLSGSTKSDMTLSMAEVQTLKLPETNLVVLSSCDSFQGHLSSDGILGITRSFVAAGVPSLVASLWGVADAATRELMRRVYNRMLQEEEDVDIALQQAMVSMIQARCYSVREWAAFVVYGLSCKLRAGSSTLDSELTEVLGERNLLEHLDAAKRWCSEQSFQCVRDVVEAGREIEFVDALQLKPLKKKLLLKDLAQRHSAGESPKA